MPEPESLTRKVALTDRSLLAMKPAPAGKRLTIWDARMPGLAVRITDKGKRSFYAVRRRAGVDTPSWVSLGAYPVVTLAEARAKAREALGALMEGKDPAVVAEEKRREEARRRADLFEVVADEFVARLESGNVRKVRGGGGVRRDATEIAAIIRREFLRQIRADGGWKDGEGALWRGRPIAEIARRDVREAIEAIVARGGSGSADGRRRGGGPYAARHAFAAVRRLFGWAVSRDLIEKSPCEGLEAVELHGAPAARDRVLTDNELCLVWRVADTAGYPFGALVKMLLLTGQRRDEIANATWSEIDGTLLTLTIPAERMKGNFVQTVPLVPAAIAILETLPRFAGGKYLFSTTTGKRPISGFSKMKARLDAAVLKFAREGAPEPAQVTIAPWTLHDLRRTVRTGLSSVGVLPIIAELTIGHKQTGISAIYDRHRYDVEKRAALTAWETKLMSIVGEPKPRPAAPDDVVPLKVRA
jgi:integrase